MILINGYIAQELCDMIKEKYDLNFEPRYNKEDCCVLVEVRKR